MSKITLNPNSIYSGSKVNFIINAEAVYAFNRSISAINGSVYGIQPTKEQYISGITLDDLEPLSANHSLCANVYLLNNNVDALKFFAQRPFVPCTSIENRDEIATNPLAIYLTPISVYNPDSGRSISKRRLMNNLKDLGIWEQVKQFLEAGGLWEQWEASTTLDEFDDENLMQSAIAALKDSFGLSDEDIENLIANSVVDDYFDSISANDSYEWAFVFKENVSWEDIKVYADGKHYLSTAVADGIAKWELIGSTSITDEKLSAIIKDINGKIEEISTGHGGLSADLSAAIDKLSDDLSSDIDKLSSDLSGEIECLSTNLSIAIDKLSSDLSDDIDKLSSDLSGYIEILSTALSLEISSTAEGLSNFIDLINNELSNNINPKLSTIADCVSAEVARVDEISAKLSSSNYALSNAIDNILTSRLPTLSSGLTSIIERVSGDLSDAIEDLSISLSDYALTSDIKNGTLEIQQNGTTLGTFSANQETGTTVNVVVPTKVSDLDNDVPYLTTADIEPINNAIQDLQDENDRQDGDIEDLSGRAEEIENDNREIHDEIDQINNRIDEIDIKAINAQNMADEAKGTAITAYTMAENAQTAAETAATAASTAQSTAEAAQTTANSNTAAIESITDEISELPNIYYKHSMDDVVGDSSENWADNYVGTAACVDLYGNHYFPDGQQHNGGVLFSSERGQILIGYDGSGNVGMWYRSYSEAGVQKNAWTILDTMKSPLPDGMYSPYSNLGEWLTSVNNFLGSFPSNGDIICQDGSGSLYKGNNSSNLLQEPPKIRSHQLALVDSIAREYSGSSAQPGQYVTYKGYLYCCISATNGGVFNPYYWKEVSVTDEFATKNELSTISVAVETEFLALSSEISSTNETLGDFIDTITDELSTNINPKLSTIAECVSAEVQKVNSLSAQTGDLSNVLSDYVKKEDLCAAILPNIEEFNRYVHDETPNAISTIVEWNAALHTALLSVCDIVL